jgi:hypothetical protein
LQLINPSTSSNELNNTLTPHSITHGDACFAYFNKIWGIPADGGLRLESSTEYIVRDRDAVYGDIFIRRRRAMGIRDRPTAARIAVAKRIC